MRREDDGIRGVENEMTGVHRSRITEERIKRIEDIMKTVEERRL